MKKLARLILEQLRQLRLRLNTALFYYRVRLFYPNVTLGKNIRLYGRLMWKVSSGARVIIGDNVIFRSSTKYNPIGLYHPVTISVSNGATLIIGDNCGFSGTSICVTESLTFGPYCNLGGNTSLWDSDFHPLDYQLRRVQVTGCRKAGISIGSDAFIGANTIILKGVSIGDRAIIGAGSVVARNIPADQIWAGNPVRFIRESTTAEAREVPQAAYTM